eukprot:12399981-Karenia_brevis.AAC.1
MVAVLQTLPSRRKGHKDHLVVSKPTTHEHLEDRGHQIEQQGRRLLCYQFGQEWSSGKKFI